jgi:two-component system nitrate/nitrite response regulator NarP
VDLMRWNGEEGRAPRLLIADHQQMVGDALAALLHQRGYVIAGRAHDGESAAAALAKGGIDAAILDIDLANPGVLALLGQFPTPLPPVIVTAPGPHHPGLPDIVESRAAGLVLKTDPADSLGHCLAAALNGGKWFDLDAVSQALDRAGARQCAIGLTRRERDVAGLVATGRRNRDIAARLGISEGTVKMHLHNVYAKLGLESRTQLAMDERLRA